MLKTREEQIPAYLPLTVFLMGNTACDILSREGYLANTPKSIT